MLCHSGYSLSQIYSILCVLSQFQEYSSGRGLAGESRRYSDTYNRQDHQVELTTAFVISSVADPPTTDELLAKFPNGRCPSSVFRGGSPTKSTSIISSTFIARDDDEDEVDRGDSESEIEQQQYHPQHHPEGCNCLTSFDHLTESHSHILQTNNIRRGDLK